VPAALVSVVIPCHNYAHYLADAILSVRQQGYVPIELIVVDDGSTDNSALLAAESGATVVRQANAGLAAARNAGMAAARGDFVVFLDADDELLADAVERGAQLLCARPELACVARQSHIMDEHRRPLPATYAPVDHSDLYGECLRQCFVWTPGAVMFRRESLARIGGFPVDVSAASDYAVYLEFARNRAVLFEPGAAVRYRHHDGNMSRDPVVMLEATLRVLWRERGRLPDGYRVPYRDALTAWRMYYGDKIVAQIRSHWRHRAMGLWDGRAVWTLARHCPRVLATHVRRKLGGVVRRVVARTRPAHQPVSAALDVARLPTRPVRRPRERSSHSASASSPPLPHD
jgi:glycosyltransferase involved in cell wall biosynthesis